MANTGCIKQVIRYEIAAQSGYKNVSKNLGVTINPSKTIVIINGGYAGNINAYNQILPRLVSVTSNSVIIYLGGHDSGGSSTYQLALSVQVVEFY